MKNDNCASGGFAGYGDLHLGTQVTVKDGAGTLLAVGVVTDAEWINQQPSEFGPPDTAGCRLDFAADSVPATEDFYVVQVASRQGSLSYSNAQLAAAGWHVDLSV